MYLMNPVPAFLEYQPMSAGGHLNALNLCVQDLHNSVLSFHEGFQGGLSRYAAYSAAIRHRYNLLDWQYKIISGTCYLVYTDVNGVATTITGTSNTGSGTYSGQADLSALGLVPGAFYTITVAGGGSYEVWLLRETRTPNYPTLINFNDEVLPTADELQDLSDYATEVETNTIFPYPATMRTGSIDDDTAFIGTVHHQCRYLGIGVYEDSQLDDVVVNINGVWVGSYSGVYGVFPSVEIDLDAIASPPNYGDDYTVEVLFDGRSKFFTMYEWPGDTEVVAGWQDLLQWDHGYFVYGSTTALQIDLYRQNLELLGAIAKYQNHPCLKNIVNADWRFSMRRHYRYLHFYRSTALEGDPAEETQDTKMAYLIGGFYKELTIPINGPGPWHVFDLDSVDALWPTTFYLIAGCTYAIEDVEA